MRKFRKRLLCLLFGIICLISYNFYSKQTNYDKNNTISLNDIPPYKNSPYIILNNNQPNINIWELSGNAFEKYYSLDRYGRCTLAVANIGPETMPKSKREPIGQIKPTGWHTTKYPNIEGKYLYNRCHLIGYQLTAENANERNLITGTRYLNVNGMLPFENKVADYIKQTGNHVLYRVTPLYRNDELIARGVIMEAMSCEDQGKGIKYCVFVYNVQPGIEINYNDGSSKLLDKTKTANTPFQFIYTYNKKCRSLINYDIFY